MGYINLYLITYEIPMKGGELMLLSGLRDMDIVETKQGLLILDTLEGFKAIGVPDSNVGLD